MTGSAVTDPLAGDPRSMRRRMTDGDLYLASDPELVALSQRAVALTDRYNALPVTERAERRRVLEDLLGAVGPDTELRAPLRVDYGLNITLGRGCFANVGLVACDVTPVTIGDHVQIGPNVQLLTPTHPLDAETRRAGWEAGAPITIGDDVWLGGGVIVLPGVTIGAATVVGAGAVVVRDLPPGVLAVGNPARVVRALS